MIENIENGGSTTVAPQKNKPSTLSRQVEYKDDKGNPLSPSISLTDDHETINIDGYTCTLADLKEHIIDSYMYRKYLKELISQREGDAK